MDLIQMQPSFSAEGQPDEISFTILTALSEVTQVDIANLQPPLYDAIDTDALEQLLMSADERLCVTFPYEQWVVKANSDGAVEVTPSSERR
ncbi:hypothetical protein HUG10_19565 (plasmid) [Halorarum halophilum]|uniref:Halobacterial output domain-containing protein n=1 Tax=Halorarum halophilum TaxID=2743090 RepID=A0A7D5H3P0_9EURY|nr:HalOD1 output domain-containing protein [Halobaculum halophilum]QLG29813.1 hypothetical protein HUG10_19565 [Halobaculum halophilum]